MVPGVPAVVSNVEYDYGTCVLSQVPRAEFNQSSLKQGLCTFLYSAMGELVCSRQLWARAALRQLQGRIARAFSSNSLVNTKDMTAAIQYILTAPQLLGSQVHYKSLE